MENEHLSLGLEDGTIDVERLLVEPQDGNLSMDSVLCFNEKITKKTMDIEDVSRGSGGSDTGIAQERNDILNGKALHAMPSEVEAGYFRSENDFCSMGEEYLLGVEFAESITNLDYGSSEGLQASVSDSQIQVSNAGSDTGCRSDIFRTYDLRDCQNDNFKVGSSKPSDSPNQCTISPRLYSLQNCGKSQNSSSSSFQDVLSDENDGRFSQAGEMFRCPKTKRNTDVALTGHDGANNVIEGQKTLAAMSVQASSTDFLPTQKRSRKPTQRYIDELHDPIKTHSKRRREVPSSIIKVKSLGVKDHKKCRVGPTTIRVVPPEEFSVVAIQVPFGSLANKECSESHPYDTVARMDSRNSVTKSKGKCGTLHNPYKMDKCVTAVDLKKMGDCSTGQKKTDGCVTKAQLKRKDNHASDATAAHQKKRNDYAIAEIRKKRDDSLTAESAEEISGRRKHHRLWTISEVRKLIDGVSQYGVGRWSRIKKLFFSASAHRTSVDLKDKWRNLLKASGMQEQGSEQGEKKRNMAWRPLPESIIGRVCELATMYPYPKGQRPKMARDSPDISADITLSDYRRILRRMNGNSVE